MYASLLAVSLLLSQVPAVLLPCVPGGSTVACAELAKVNPELGKDLNAHCGYQDWHRAIDKEIRAWLETNRKATAEQFEAFLRELHARPELRARFPNGS